jgi:uncharacterized membrane protein YjjP (DUF1212 family)
MGVFAHILGGSLCQSLVGICAGFLVCIMRKRIADRCFVCTLCVLDISALDVY